MVQEQCKQENVKIEAKWERIRTRQKELEEYEDSLKLREKLIRDGENETPRLTEGTVTTKDEVTKTQENTETQKQMGEIICTRCLREIDMEEKEAKDIWEMLDNFDTQGCDANALTKLLKKTWPQRTYTKTKEIQGNPMRGRNDWDLVLLTRGEKTGLIERAKERYPVIDDLLQEGIEPGQMQYLENITRIKSGMSTHRRVYIGAAKHEEELLKALQWMSREATTAKRKKLIVAASEEYNLEDVRRILEIALWKTEIEVEFYVPPRRNDNRGRRKIERQRDTEAIVIKAGAASYAELVKSVKKSVDPVMMGVEIKALRKTRAGEMLVVTNRGGAEPLRKEIAEKVADAQIKNVSNAGKTLHISGIDITTTKEDVEGSIAAALTNEGKENINVKALRPTRNGSQIATVTIPTVEADTLIKEGKIRIGWVVCRVRPRVEVTRCINCLKLGHNVTQCKEPKEEKRSMPTLQENNRNEFQRGGPPELRILQLNANRSSIAHDLLEATAVELQIDILVISEPNRKKISGNAWMMDEAGDVAIKLRNKDLSVKGHGHGNGYAWVDLNVVRIYSCYVSPNVSMDIFGNFLNELEASIHNVQGEIIVTGDFNSKSPEWGSKWEDRRGNILTQWIAANKLIIQNKGEEPTFIRGGSVSHLDITCTTEKTAKRVVTWKVLEQESMSDHRYVYMEIGAEEGPTRTHIEARKGWLIGKFNKTKFIDDMGASIHDPGNTSIETCIEIISKACDAAMPKKNSRIENKRTAVYWWSEDIAQLRRDCIKNRRIMQRERRKGHTAEAERTRYKESKKELQHAICKAKDTQWSKLCDEVEDDIWGQGYRIVMKKFPAIIKMDPGKKKEIAKKTEAILAIGRKRHGHVEFLLEGKLIETTDSLKYLGVIIDKGMTFGKHITHAANRASAAATALCRIMPRIGGSSESKRRILSAVTDSILLYASPIWENVLKYQKYRTMTDQVQRKMALRISRGYRTISTEAARVISRIVPIDLMVEERTGTIGMAEAQKRNARKNTIAKWQNRWQNSGKDIWLHRLMPDITVWYYRTHGEVDSWLTQVMTSHGSFQAYLKRISKSDDDTCTYCHEEPDDACHTLFRCNRWREQRERMEATLGQELRPGNLIHSMLED
ncbi:hypothetical protein NQ314_013609, partial [Rhamnusium bicolor]